MEHHNNLEKGYFHNKTCKITKMDLPRNFLAYALVTNLFEEIPVKNNREINKYDI